MRAKWVVAAESSQEERTWHSGVGWGTPAVEGTEVTAGTLVSGNSDTETQCSNCQQPEDTELGGEKRKNRKWWKRIDLMVKEGKGLQGSPGTPRALIALTVSHRWVSLPDSQQLLIKG